MRSEVVTCGRGEQCRRDAPPREVLDRACICHQCGDRVRRALRQLPAAIVELRRSLASGGRGGERVSGSPEPPLPFSIPVMEHLDQLGHDMRWWSSFVATGRGLVLSGARDPDVLAEWLVLQVDWMRHRDEVPEFAEVVLHDLGRARALADLPVDRSRFEVGPCPERIDSEPCEGRVWAYIPTHADSDPPLLACDICAKSWPSTQWLRTGRRIKALLARAA